MRAVVRTLSKRFMAMLEHECLQLETGRDPAPTSTPLTFYCVSEPSTGEPLASVWEVPLGTTAQDIERDLYLQLKRDGIF